MKRSSSIRIVAAVIVLCLASGLTSCAQLRTFQHCVTPYGGHDAAGADDQIYFEVRNVRGVSGNGIGALHLPSDWPARATVTDAEGTLRLAPPVEPGWAFGSELSPSVHLRHPGESWPGALNLAASDDRNPLDVPVLAGVDSLAEVTPMASERVRAGANAYALVLPPDSGGVPPEPDEPRHEYRLFGARAGESGVEWIELTTLTFEDSRSGVGRTLDVPLREYPTLNYALIAAALIWPVFLL